MKIIKSFSYPEFAAKRSYECVRDKSYAYFGVDSNNSLYIKARMSGFSVEDWCPYNGLGPAKGMTFHDMQYIVAKLS